MDLTITKKLAPREGEFLLPLSPNDLKQIRLGDDPDVFIDTVLLLFFFLVTRLFLFHSQRSLSAVHGHIQTLLVITFIFDSES